MANETETSQSQTNAKGGGKKVIIGVGVVAVAAAVGIGAFFATRGGAEEPEEKKKVVTADTADEVVSEMMSPDEGNIPQEYTVTQNSEWTFADGKSESDNAYVENAKENQTDVYFDLIVDETGEVVYSSPVLERGAVLENFKLDTPLEAGEYDCTVQYHLVDEDQNTLTTTNVGTTVKVLK